MPVPVPRAIATRAGMVSYTRFGNRPIVRVGHDWQAVSVARIGPAALKDY